MKAEIIAIGTELLLGEIADTNTSFLANQLAGLGIDLYFASTVGDNRQRLTGVLRTAWQRSELILTTGGLGPTQGDITRETIAAFLGEEMRLDPELKRDLVSFFKQRGLEMPLNNLKQAMLIPSSAALRNPRGTAPGWWVEKDGRTIVVMPGPPGEMQLMWQNEVSPRLKEKVGGIILSRLVKTFGLSESKVDEMLAPLIASANPTLASYARPDGIYLRITAKADQPEAAQEMVARYEAEIRATLGEAIWGTDSDTLEGVVGQLLAARGLSLAAAESFTGGSLTQLLANAPQSQAFFKGGFTATADEAKIACGLDPAVTAGPKREVAAAMASLARRKLSTQVGISVEAAPARDGLIEIFVAIDSEPAQRNRVQSYSGRVYFMRNRAASYALFDLMKWLKLAGNG
ncbi:MAG: CinA family nicotinamide mononucleotide deamidase-related protein [Chloroflexota bacterium]|nr:CinA family nicotinamide mononucleotide deamidase-related protein [Chloroflexota bacterium]